MRITDLISRVQHYFSLKDSQPEETFSDEELLQDAYEKLMEARNVFSVTDPEFIDYAVYNLRAAEERYNCLVKIIKNK